MNVTRHALHVVLASSAMLGAMACATSGDDDEGSHPISLTTIGAGYYTSCGLDAAGMAWCWGDGITGQLGFTPPDVCPSAPEWRLCALFPGEVATSLRFSTISLGGAHACALSGVEIWCWGSDAFGQLGNGTAAETCAQGPTPCARAPVRALLEAKQVSTGDSHTCALVEDGHAFCWGYGSSGRLGNGSNANTPTPTPLAGDFRFRSISAGGASTCAIDTEGAAWCWGYNHLGQLGDGTTTPQGVPTAVATTQRFTAVSVGTASACALAVDGTAYCWGIAVPEGPASATSLCEVSVPCATSPQKVSARQFLTLTTGERYACGIGAGGSFCWGQLPWTTEPVTVPAPFGVAGLSAGEPFVAISLSSGGGCGVTASDAAYCWGGDVNGRLGDGPMMTDTGLPVRVVTSPGE